jgi:hypothetical protein
MRGYPIVLVFAAEWVYLTQFANAGYVSPGFLFCGSPSPAPRCLSMTETYNDGDQAKHCQDEISRYTMTVAAYRTCLLLETQRAVTQMNSNIDRFKCGIREKHPC